ncbi:hypothetical protein M595_6179 [Lyngbya aestuarii BL J]|uniref:Uncharacterized protein n=1 Tax=Lyngbya aestuarii BL J TaxID=1348334 RepID=U7Q7X6_9CYAN|nr:hypothetical protein M595_6179 [Lyngbya aestuarii BL J]
MIAISLTGDGADQPWNSFPATAPDESRPKQTAYEWCGQL